MKRFFKYCILLKRFIPIVLLLGLLNFASCKSHKKNVADSQHIEEQTIKLQNNKKKEKKLTIGEKVAKEAVTWVGTPYKYARQDKGKATDCSGMVYVIYQEIANIKLPRNSAKQADFCESVTQNEVRAGDLVFFATGKDKNKVSHVGIMLGKNKFVHSSASKGVIISEMTTPYYQRNFIKYGRPPY